MFAIDRQIAQEIAKLEHYIDFTCPADNEEVRSETAYIEHLPEYKALSIKKYE